MAHPARSSIAIPVSLLLGGAALATQPSDAPPPTPTLGIGAWCAEVRVKAQTTSVAIRIHEGDEGLGAVLDLPAIDAWGVPLGPVEVSDDSVAFGPWTLEWANPGKRIRGVLPRSLVPDRDLVVDFAPCEALERPAPDWSHPEPEISWTASVGGPVWAGLELDPDERSLTIATDQGTVLLLAPDSGRTLWTRDLGASVRARPSRIGDGLFLVADDGVVTRLDPASGEVRWRSEIGAGPPRLGIDEPGTRWERSAASVVGGTDRLWVGGRDGGVHCLEAATGRRVWRSEVGDVVSATPALADGRVVVATFAGSVLALSASTGEVLWQHETGFPVPEDLVVADGKVLAGSRSYELLALDLDDGTPVWNRYFWFSWIDSPPRVANGVAYVGSSDGLLLSALSVDDGRPVWQQRVPGWSWAGPAVGADLVFTGTVGTAAYLGPRRGSFLAADRSTGEIVWIFSPPAPEEGQWGFAASPAVGSRHVFAADLEGTVFAFPLARPGT